MQNFCYLTNVPLESNFPRILLLLAWIYLAIFVLCFRIYLWLNRLSCNFYLLALLGLFMIGQGGFLFLYLKSDSVKMTALCQAICKRIGVKSILMSKILRKQCRIIEKSFKYIPLFSRGPYPNQIDTFSTLVPIRNPFGCSKNGFHNILWKTLSFKNAKT